MKKSIFILAALLFLSGNTAAFADTLSGKVKSSNDYINHTLISNGKTIQLSFDKPTELKTGQVVEVKGKLQGDDRMQVDKVIVLRKKV